MSMWKTLLFLVACIGITTIPTGSWADCERFPRYCDAVTILEDQPDIDLLQGVRARESLTVLNETLIEAQTDLLEERFAATQVRIDQEVLESRARIEAMLAAAKPNEVLSAADQLLKIVGFLAKLSVSLDSLVAPEGADRASDGEVAADGQSEDQIVQGSKNDTGIMLLSDEHFASEEARARATRIAASRVGSRYFTVRAILDRLEELGPPQGDGTAALPTEQEFLLAEAYAVLAGWEETEADAFFRNFDPTPSALEDVLQGRKLPHPATVFLDVFFKSQPVGDGTIESVLNVPSFERELSVFAEQQFRWRYPEFFSEGATVPWRAD